VSRRLFFCLKVSMARAMPRIDILGFKRSLITTRQGFEEIAAIVNKAIAEVT